MRSGALFGILFSRSIRRSGMALPPEACGEVRRRCAGVAVLRDGQEVAGNWCVPPRGEVEAFRVGEGTLL
jgi:hypothetical protein